MILTKSRKGCFNEHRRTEGMVGSINLCILILKKEYSLNEHNRTEYLTIVGLDPWEFQNSITGSIKIIKQTRHGLIVCNTWGQ